MEKNYINAFDIETYVNNENKLTPYCISYTLNNEIEFFYGINCINNFIDLILLQNNKIYYAHNLTFDGYFVLKELMRRKIKFNYFLLKNRIYYIKLIGNKIDFKCSYMLFPYSLSKAEKIIMCTKKINFNHKNIDIKVINQEPFKKKILKYCKNDVTIVIEILKFYDKALLGLYINWSSKMSISSITLNLFKENYNPFKIKTTLTYKNDCIFRKSYFGGRCEIFGNAQDSDFLYHFDFKGMYSQVMTEDFPIGDFSLNNPSEVNNVGFYFIDVYSNMKLPILPFRSEDNKLIFPNGYFSGLYWYEEINYFMSKGGVVLKIHYAYTFLNKKKVFKNFTETMSKLRDKNDQNNFIFKLVNNSLYGRLGMSFQEEETLLINSSELTEIEKKHDIKKYSILNDMCILTIKKKININDIIKSNVIYASITTSKARIKLHKGFLDVENNGGIILYCDTDSIFAAFKKNVDNEKHGEIFWDTTKKDTKIMKAVFALPKMYALMYNKVNWKIKIKGIKKPSLSFDEFENKFYKNESYSSNESQLFIKNFEFNEKNIIKLINFDKKYYTKRLFSDDLKSSEPLYLKAPII